MTSTPTLSDHLGIMVGHTSISTNDIVDFVRKTCTAHGVPGDEQMRLVAGVRLLRADGPVEEPRQTKERSTLEYLSSLPKLPAIDFSRQKARTEKGGRRG